MENEVLYIVIPCYNEMECIEDVIREWYPVVLSYNACGNSRLLIMDDGSTDETGRILDRLKDEFKYLTVIHKENSGHASSCMEGYEYAINKGADYIFQTDSDGQTRAEEFIRLWEKRNDSDVIMGFRKKRGDGFSRLIVSRVLMIVVLLTFGVRVKDANVPFRLMKRDALKDAMKVTPKNYFLSNVILSAAFEKTGHHIENVPITFSSRSGGESMYQGIKKFIRIGIESVFSFIHYNHLMDKRIKEL